MVSFGGVQRVAVDEFEYVILFTRKESYIFDFFNRKEKYGGYFENNLYKHVRKSNMLI